jgi:hypothetical protein
MVRLMADGAFRAGQDRDRYADHVRPVNELVDELRGVDGRGWLPYVAPVHGGVRARMLFVLRDPGPMTREGTGSGYLCIENDDPTAERQDRAFASVGIAVADTTPWNAYPWYINRRPTAAEREAGVEPLIRLVTLMPDLRVVLLQGRDAHDVWRRLVRRRPGLVSERDLSVVETYHPGRQALWSPDPLVRQQRHQDRIKSYHRAAELLRTTVVPAAGRTTTTGTCQADDHVASSLAAARWRSTSSLAAENAVALRRGSRTGTTGRTTGTSSGRTT